jgi:hypothetical protein
VHHPWADIASSSALCLGFVAAAGLLFHASASRGCVMSAARPLGAGAALSDEGAASKEAQARFALDDHVHVWPAPGDVRTVPQVGWSMLMEVSSGG